MRKFDPYRVALVDSLGTSALIRGPYPMVYAQFSYSGISKAAGVDLTARQILSISLIDCTGERSMLAAELQAFGQPDCWASSYWPPFERVGYESRKQYGTRVTDESGVARNGSVAWWPIEGIGNGQDPAQLLGWPGYNFSGLVDWITEVLASPGMAVYVHCSLGADRTGAAIAGYLVRNRRMSAEDALAAVSAQTPAGAPNADYVRLVRAYAASLGQ